MKKTFYSAFAFCAVAAMLVSCDQKEEGINPELSSNTVSNLTVEEGCDVIDFEGYSGFITSINSQKGVGPIATSAIARTESGAVKEGNRAMIFDTFNPTGDDKDLGTGSKAYNNNASLGKTMIVQNIFVSDPLVPNDNSYGGLMTLDFAAVGPVVMKSITVMDIDSYENMSYVRLLGDKGNELLKVTIPVTGDNGVTTIDLKNTAGVAKMEVNLEGRNNGKFSGSGAIDNIVFCKESTTTPPPTTATGCTRTQGYWKTHAEGKKYDSTWGNLPNTTFFSSGKTYLEILNAAPKGGDAYLILAHQYIAAMLNLKAGASMPTDVQKAYNMATDYFNNNTNLDKATLTQLADTLAKYNEGKIGPGHCD